jgi:hypothetical protein
MYSYHKFFRENISEKLQNYFEVDLFSAVLETRDKSISRHLNRPKTNLLIDLFTHFQKYFYVNPLIPLDISSHYKSN